MPGGERIRQTVRAAEGAAAEGRPGMEARGAAGYRAPPRGGGGLLADVEEDGVAAAFAVVFDGDGFLGGPAGELEIVADDAGAGF